MSEAMIREDKDIHDATVASRTPKDHGRRPDFLIVGGKRCGTSSLARYLAEHPHLYVPPQKEVHYFDLHVDRGLGWYEAQFSEAAPNQLACDATPSYIYLEWIPGQMAEVVPEARIIAILRNPTDRAYSDYWFVRGRGHEKLSFEEAIDSEPRRLRSNDPRAALHYTYLSRGHYVKQLERLCEHFPRGNISVLLFEDLIAKPLEIFSDLCRFLDVDDAIVPPSLGQRANRTLRSGAVKGLAGRLPTPIKRVVRRLNTRSSYPPMKPETRRRLIDLYRESNEALGAWLGRDLTHWNS